MLIHSLAIRCSYPASPIQERVYAAAARFGIFLYTGSPDAEGTLGGLVQQARNIEDHLEHAREMGALCSKRPGVRPAPARRRRHGGQAAARGGLPWLRPRRQTSCEIRNEYLDRTLVVLGHPRRGVLRARQGLTPQTRPGSLPCPRRHDRPKSHSFSRMGDMRIRNRFWVEEDPQEIQRRTLDRLRTMPQEDPREEARKIERETLQRIHRMDEEPFTTSTRTQLARRSPRED